MSMKKFAVIAAVSTHNSLSNQTVSVYNAYTNQTTNIRGHGHHHQGLQNMRPGANLHGNVNIMLGGAMLSVVITVVCFVCYCCHRNIKKRSNSVYRQQWLENEANMEIYSVEQCYDTPAGISTGSTGAYFLDNVTGNEYRSLPATVTTMNHHQHHLHPQHHPNGPPPSYDTVLAQDEFAARRKSCDFSASAYDTADSGSRGGSGSTKFDSLLYDPVGNMRRKQSRQMEPEFNDFSGVFGSMAPVSFVEGGNCNCPLSDSLQVYCRNCGQFVDGEVQMQNHFNNNHNDGVGVNWPGSATIHGGNLLDCDGTTDSISDNNGNIQTGNNGEPQPRPPLGDCRNRNSGLNELLQDLLNGAAAAGCNNNPLDCTNNNNGNCNDDGPCHGNASYRPGADDAKHNEENNNNNNNNAASGTATEPIKSRTKMNGRACTTAPAATNDDADAGESDSNNANSSTSTNDSAVGVGLPTAVEAAAAGTGGNKSADTDRSNGGREADTFRNLTENGLIRLDMSQIIDQTGLPTYEAALRLESSGYV